MLKAFANAGASGLTAGFSSALLGVVPFIAAIVSGTEAAHTAYEWMRWVMVVLVPLVLVFMLWVTDIEELATHCHFSDCTHTKAVKCAVLAAVENGDLARERYDSYMKLQQELKFLESKQTAAGYAENRRRQRSQGKLYKQIQAEQRKRKKKM